MGDAFAVVEKYWQEPFRSWGTNDPTTAPWVTPLLLPQDSAVGDFSSYCPTDAAAFCDTGRIGTVTWDKQFFRDFSYLGDVFPYIVMAHEYGHAAQARFIHDDQGPAVKYQGDQRELQADCLAGVTMAWVLEQGLITLEAGDEDEMVASLLAIGDPQPGEGHGTGEQRQEWYFMGYRANDIEVCLGNRGDS